ncbi:AraC family transcriptional regulator [Bordetella sp. H567]|uniref:AraC family transcriptional regulator n=1 Tax=Bordetella sp. H567 TaxID=1697043 RepID=UPI00081CDA41|nr:helix-turn-helix transcriptional regulator [Bordetella sp. H567]AOB33180.1 AraC family transcriptional regulator [Bordetella sp. H567]
MAWLAQTVSFDPDPYPAEVLGLAASLGNHDSGRHAHERGQLLYARQGCIRITLADRLCMLPPSRAAWIPGGTVHRAVMRNIVDYRSLYFRQDVAALLPAEVRVIDVSPLLQAVLEPIALASFDQGWQEGRHAHLLGLCLDEIRSAPCEPMLLPLPHDRRLSRLLARLDRLPPELKGLEADVGASGRTITRIFRQQTGMSYQQWRQQWRLMRAIELLAVGHGISYVAAELRFSSDSVFIAFFRKMLGETPRAYLKRSR